MGVVRWILASGLRVALTIALITGLLHVVNELQVLAGAPPGFFQRLELTALDVKFAARGEREPEQWKVAVAGMDEKAVRRFGPPPWPRSVHAEIIDRLTELGASSIAFDMTFEQATPNPRAEVYEEMREELAAAPLLDIGKGLNAAAAEVEAVSKKIKAVRRPKSVRQLASPLKASAKATRKAATALTEFREQVTRPRRASNPDDAFVESIRKSGRVVLGVVGLSQRETDALGIDASTVAIALSRVTTSTVAELTVPGADGLDRVVPAGDSFSEGLYRRYFGLGVPFERLADAGNHFALINASPDPDGVNRRLPLLSGFNQSAVLMPTLALEAVRTANGNQPLEVIGELDAASPEAIRLNGRRLETGLRTFVVIDWHTPFAVGMPVFSVADLLDKKVDPSSVKDKVVFVAPTALGLDQRITPIESAVPGVHVHATLAQNLLDGRQLLRPLDVVILELGFMLLIGLVAGLVMARVPVWAQVFVAVLLGAGWIALDKYFLFEEGLIVATVLPMLQISATLLAIVMWSYLIEQRERRKTRQAFGQYLSPRVLEHVLSKPEEFLRLGGRRYEATVLFSDIRGFTGISERLSPEELGALLNQYMTPMTDLVFEHQGTLDKYIGDAVMAFWGAPVEQPDHAILACRTALAMLREVDVLNERFVSEGLPEIAIGLGISSGPMTIGNMGSDAHFAYTALGDRVNLGARLEGQTKPYGVDCIIAEDTWQQVKNDMFCRELGSLRVKGKQEPTRIFELIGPSGAAQDRQRFVDTFHEGLVAFRSRDFEKALEHFQLARALQAQGDKTCDLYIVWCQEYQRDPPPADWDGVRTATEK